MTLYELGTHFARQRRIPTPLEQAYVAGFSKVAATQEQIFSQLHKYLPAGSLHASGGIPDTNGISDVDIALLSTTPHELLTSLPPSTVHTQNDNNSIYSIPGYDREVNLYASSNKDLVDRAVTHRNVELLLRERYPALFELARKRRVELKEKTEPAWAAVLGLSGDPYEAMLDSQAALDAANLKTEKQALDLSDYEQLYAELDSTHGAEHAKAVESRALELARKYAPKQIELASLAAKLHDVGISKGRDRHEHHGAAMVASDPRFASELGSYKTRLLVNAIREHRASTGKPTSMVGRILSDADRTSAINAAGQLRRAYDYGKAHKPELSDDDQVIRALSHLVEKYGPGGRGRRFYFPETGERLDAMHNIIAKLHQHRDIAGARQLIA